MKWVVIGVAVLLGLAGLVAVIGALLPRDHTASRSAVIHQPPETVWAAIRDLGGVPGWWPEIKSAERLPDQGGREVWRQTMRSNYAMPLEVAEADPPRRLVTRITAPEGAPFGGRWIYEIAPASVGGGGGGGGGSTVTITEEGWIANPVFRFMANVMGLDTTLKSYLKALGRKFGEDVEIS